MRDLEARVESPAVHEAVQVQRQAVQVGQRQSHHRDRLGERHRRELLGVLQRCVERDHWTAQSAHGEDAAAGPGQRGLGAAGEFRDPRQTHLRLVFGRVDFRRQVVGDRDDLADGPVGVRSPAEEFLGFSVPGAFARCAGQRVRLRAGQQLHGLAEAFQSLEFEAALVHFFGVCHQRESFASCCELREDTGQQQDRVFVLQQQSRKALFLRSHRQPVFFCQVLWFEACQKAESGDRRLPRLSSGVFCAGEPLPAQGRNS